MRLLACLLDSAALVSLTFLAAFLPELVQELANDLTERDGGGA